VVLGEHRGQQGQQRLGLVQEPPAHLAAVLWIGADGPLGVLSQRPDTGGVGRDRVARDLLDRCGIRMYA
jgi:hypothetical protein